MRTGLIAVCVMIVASGMAQPFHFRSITENQGLSDNRVTCFQKDKDGFMWIGTENGLNRYDGYEFVIYRPGQTRHALSHERINDIEQDDRGRLWIATWAGLNVLSSATDSLHIFRPAIKSADRENTISSDITWDVLNDHQGRMWLAIDARELGYYDLKTDRFVYIPWRERARAIVQPPSGTYLSIQKLALKSDHELWLGTTVGLFSFNQKDESFIYYGGEIGLDFLDLFCETNTNRVYFVQERPFMVDLADSTLVPVLHRQEYLINKSSALLMSSPDGLWAIDRAQMLAVKVPVDERKPFSLHHQKPTTIFRDGKLLWVGSSNGILIHDERQNVFPFVPVFSDTSTASYVHTIMDDEENDRYYVSTYRKNALVIVDKATQQSTWVRAIDGEPLVRCSGIYRDSHKQIWILTAYALFVSDVKTGEFRRVPLPRDNYGFIEMTEDADGNFWFAAMEKGIYKYDPFRNNWKHFEYGADELFVDRATSLISDPLHRSVWIGDYSFGVFNYEMDSNRFIYHDMEPMDTVSLKSSLINDIAVDHDGNVWCATTSGGVSKYKREEKRFVTYRMDNGMPENSFNAVTIDHNGNVWLASDVGLTCMRTNGSVIRHFDALDGFSYTHFNTPFSTNRKGELMIGLEHGFIKFHPDSLQLTSENFSVAITRALQGAEAFQSGTFKYFQNEFMFQFAALTYSLPQEVKYYYRLRGLNDEWIQAGNQHSVRYSNVGQGDYIFQVKAMDHTGKWSTNVASVAFSIQPPLWKETWFVVLLIALCISAIAFWIDSLQHRVRVQKMYNRLATSLYNRNTLEAVFSAVTESCTQLRGVHSAAVWTTKPASQEMTLVASLPADSSLHRPVPGVVQDVVSSGHPSIRKGMAIRRWLTGSGYPEVAAPVKVDDRVLAVIHVVFQSARRSSRRYLSVVKGIAAICDGKIGKYFIEENIRRHVARDLHDDIGSTLSSINIMSQLAIQQDSQTQDHLVKIANQSSRMMESMSDIIWSLNPVNDSLAMMVVKMKEFAGEILEPKDISYSFDVESANLATTLTVECRKNLFLVFKELANNAAKYSGASHVAVRMATVDGSLRLSVQDDGQGFQRDKIQTGNGLINIEQRVQSLGGRAQWSNSKGAAFEASIPIS